MAWNKRYTYNALIEQKASEYAIRKAKKKARARGNSDYDRDEAERYYKRKVKQLYKRTQKPIKKQCR